jgi:hypothetical protein
MVERQRVVILVSRFFLGMVQGAATKRQVLWVAEQLLARRLYPRTRVPRLALLGMHHLSGCIPEHGRPK